MKKKPSILSLFLIFSVTVCTFGKTGSPAGGLNTGSAFQKFWPEMKTDTGGRVVNLDSAQACIDRYSILMKAHGFSDQAGQAINIHLTKTDMITNGESFDGKKLQDWLNFTATQYAAAGKTLMIKIQMGVYDMNYLNTYQPDPAKKTASNNRIAIFIIPYDGKSGITVKGLAQPMGSGGTSGGTGYDLGGIQP